MKEEKDRKPLNIQLVLGLLLAILLVVFTLQNAESIPIKIFFWNIRIPLAILILVCLLIGYLLPHISYLPRIWKLKSELSQTRKEKEKLEEKEKSRQPKTKPNPEGYSFDEIENEEDNSGGFF